MPPDAVGIRGRWVTSAVLRALAAVAPNAGDTFTRSLLCVQLGHDPGSATRKLLALQFITMQRGVDHQGRPTVTYTVTPDGAAAIEAAAGGAVIKGGGCPPHPAKPGSLRARLWSLLRMRKLLDADTAAQVLCDAGEARYPSVVSQINAHLRGWLAAGVVQLSSAQLGRGRKRYVLLQDPGPDAPATRTRRGAR